MSRETVTTPEPETFAEMNRALGKYFYDRPNLTTEDRTNCAFAYLCSEIDKLKSQLNDQ